MQKLRKKQFAKALSVGKAKRSSQKSRDALQQADAANGKDAGICPLAAVNCHTDELTSSDNDIAPAGSISDNGSPTAQALLKGPASASDSKAAAFIHWAQSQSSSKQVSIDDFIVQQCQQDFVSQDALSMEGILAAAAAGGMLMPNISCSPADDSAQQLTVEPYLPHNGHVKGAPKPQCHADRIVAADGINALRATRDGEIGEGVVAAGSAQLVNLGITTLQPYSNNCSVQFTQQQLQAGWWLASQTTHYTVYLCMLLQVDLE